ncbi:hypothetical protein ANCCAN_07163 [Ancylostoma caninum]|uniref:Uncharacterized protein n=1 Tax=Ancylostoma caninum TaxID=29170 RepID=A0A368GR85_ANCCA|nr:hypothetical protein ANCCAN_07163 [Ancylostoma caninum]
MTVAYSHRGSSRRIEEAKRKARPELNNFGWDTLGLAEKFAIPDIQDNILRVDGKKLSLDEFREKYERPRIPCILKGLSEEWEAHEIHLSLAPEKGVTMKCLLMWEREIHVQVR